MSRDDFPVGSEWSPKDRKSWRQRIKRVLRHQSNPMMLTVASIKPDGNLSSAMETYHWEVFGRMYEPAHYAHPDGGESGTCRPLSQDVV